MTDEKKEPWLNIAALATVALAVFATLSNFKGSSFSTRSVLAQSQASDQWAYYQAKSIKGYMYDLQRDKLQLELKEKADESHPAIPAIEDHKAKIASYTKTMERYDKEKEEIKAAAEKLEKYRDDSRRHSQSFGIALIFFQIAILISSIAAFLKKKGIWFIGLAVSIPGYVYFLDGFLTFLK